MRSLHRRISSSALRSLALRAVADVKTKTVLPAARATTLSTNAHPAPPAARTKSAACESLFFQAFGIPLPLSEGTVPVPASPETVASFIHCYKSVPANCCSSYRQHNQLPSKMLPDSLSESYREYKADTNAFVTWLSTTAISCGYSFTPANDSISKPVTEQTAPGTTTRLKGKARKDAKASQITNKPQTATTNHLVSVKELLAQAEFVAAFKKPRVKVPLGTQYVLQCAINTRKKCTAWFQNSTVGEQSSEHVSNSTHQHFTSILESAFKILAPNCALAKPSKPSHSAKLAPAKASSDTSLPADLGNRFEALEVEELDDETVSLLVAEATSVTTPKTPRTNSRSGTVDTYELNVGVKEELPFLVGCFIEDLHKLREFVKQTWQSVADGQLNHMSASVVVNVAVSTFPQF